MKYPSRVSDGWDLHLDSKLETDSGVPMSRTEDDGGGEGAEAKYHKVHLN